VASNQPDVQFLVYVYLNSLHVSSNHVDSNKHIIEKTVLQVGYLPQIIYFLSALCSE